MSPVSRYGKPADLPPSLPVFPLRGAIVLPRAALPLNIFEPRYLAMLNDVISGSRVFGMVQPADAAEGVESPIGKATKLRRIGCAGRVTAFQELDDGRLLITLTGVARFNIVREIASVTPYRICEVDYEPFAGDFEAGRGENAVDRDRLLKALEAYLQHRQMKADWRAISTSTTEFLVNALSVISPHGPEEKQALLEAPDLPARADILITLAEMDVAGGGGETSTLQ